MIPPAVLPIAVVGLGVTSIQLIRQLEREGVEYLVFTKEAFGIWAKLYDAGENFDLVTTTESTNFHDMEWEYDFPFYTAKQYYEKLRSFLTPEIEARVRYTTVGKVSWSTEHGEWELIDSAGNLLAKAVQLVVSVGFEPDGSIIENMGRASRITDSTVLVNGFRTQPTCTFRGSC